MRRSCARLDRRAGDPCGSRGAAILAGGRLIEDGDSSPGSAAGDVCESSRPKIRDLGSPQQRGRALQAPLLVTIAVSHFCEKARWGLDHAEVAYREERHAPGLHALAVRRHGGSTGTPLLVTEEGVISDSTAILLWANAQARHHRLYPQDLASRSRVIALEDRFDELMGPHVRRLMYFHLLQERQLVLPLMTHEVPAYERLLLSVLFRPLRGMMRASMRINAEAAAQSHDALMQILDEVSGLLADGREYLCGEQFGAADITFASLLAPAALPAGYAVPLPSLADLPPKAARVVRAVRDTAAGAHCLRMYRNRRTRP